MDAALVRILNSVSGSALIDAGIAAGAVALPYVVLFAAIWFVFSRSRVQERMYAFAVAALATILARGIVTEVIRYFYNRPRPFEVIEGMNQVIAHAAGGSFPSGHMTFYAALVAALFFVRRFSMGDTYRFRSDKWTIALGVLVILIGIFRIMAGVHWPSDILAGIGIGVASAWGVARLVLTAKS